MGFQTPPPHATLEHTSRPGFEEVDLGTGSHRAGRRRRDRGYDPRLSILAACAAGLLLVGCADNSPTGPTQPRPKPHPVLASPQIVLSSLTQAYVARDSVWYGQLFDPLYQGSSFDPGMPPGQQLLAFSRADEIRHVGALLKTPSVYRVDLVLGPSWIRYSDPVDPLGWATIRTVISRLAIEDLQQGTTKGRTDVIQEFKFIPTTPAPKSPTDTTWTIIRWSEVAP